MDQQLIQTSQFCQVFGGSTPDFGYDGPMDPSDRRPFAIVDGKIVNWCCMCGRAFVSDEGKETAIKPNTSAWLEITHPSASGGFSIKVCMGDSYANTGTKTYLKLYDFDEDGIMKRDYRGMPTMPFYN